MNPLDQLDCPSMLTFLQIRFLLAEGMAFMLAMFVLGWWWGWWRNFWPLLSWPWTKHENT